MLKKELIEKLKIANLSTTGTKAVLALRYDEYLKQKETTEELTPTSASLSTNFTEEVDEKDDGEVIATEILPDNNSEIKTSVRFGDSAESIIRSAVDADESSSENDSDASDDEDHESLRKGCCTTTVLALPVFCNLKVNKRALTPFLKFRGNGLRVAVCNDNKDRPQVSGIANIRQEMEERRHFTKCFFEIDKPEEYEPWGRYLIQPTTL